jgi:hypothetical protein
MIYKLQTPEHIMLKKRIKKSKMKHGIFETDIQKNIEEEGEILEKWMIERRKFFIKLAWLFVIVAGLLIISNIYLKVNGVGW